MGTLIPVVINLRVELRDHVLLVGSQHSIVLQGPLVLVQHSLQASLRELTVPASRFTFMFSCRKPLCNYECLQPVRHQLHQHHLGILWQLQALHVLFQEESMTRDAFPEDADRFFIQSGHLKFAYQCVCVCLNATVFVSFLGHGLHATYYSFWEWD